MLKIIFNQETYEYLRVWAEGYTDELIYCPAFAKKTSVYFGKPYQDIVGIFEATGYGYKLAFKESGSLIFKGKLTIDKTKRHAFNVNFSGTEFDNKEDQEAYFYALQVCCTAFIHANAFLRLGNLLENRKYIAAGRNDGDDKIIVFRKYKDTLYAIPIGHHRSPEGVFGVRGHFRRYKNGKIIWIDEYLKGTEKETPQKE